MEIVIAPRPQQITALFMNRLTTIDIRKQYLHFSAGHFTIFSATERERLHGHNFRIAAKITGPVGDDGLCFDYAIFKDIMRDICERFNEYTLIAEQSPHLQIESDEQFHHVTHNNITMPLLRTDTILLPLRNITIEELASYLLGCVLEHQTTLEQYSIQAMEIHVASGPDQWASCEWFANSLQREQSPIKEC